MKFNSHLSKVNPFIVYGLNPLLTLNFVCEINQEDFHCNGSKLPIEMKETWLNGWMINWDLYMSDELYRIVN